MLIVIRFCVGRGALGGSTLAAFFIDEITALALSLASQGPAAKVIIIDSATTHSPRRLRLLKVSLNICVIIDLSISRGSFLLLDCRFGIFDQ